MQKHPILCRCRQRGAAAIPEGHLSKRRVGVPFLHRAATVDQRHGIPVRVLQRVQPLIQGAISIRIPIPQHQGVHIHRAPDIPRHRIRPDLRLQQLPITAEEAICHRGADGIRHMAVQGVATISHDYHIRRILDLEDPVPGVVNETVVVLIRRQVAVAVIHGRGGAADGRDFVLLVGRPCLRGAVRGDGVPVADSVIVPGLAVRWGPGDIRLATVQRAQLVTGNLVQRIIGVHLAQGTEDLVVLVKPVAVPVIAVLVPVQICAGPVDPALVDHSPEPVQPGVLIPRIAGGLRGQLDVAEIDAGLRMRPLDHGAEPQVAVGLQGVGRIAQRT